MKIFYNANIYTLGKLKPSAFAVDQGVFVAFGSDAEILDSFISHTKAVNLQGKTVWPGLTDSHVHLQHMAAARSMVDCETETIEECLARVKARADQLPPDTWVRGHGWNQNSWENGYGTADMLESACGGRPAYLTAKSLHAAWVNHTALKMAGVCNQNVDSSNTGFQRDEFGIPTGILFEAQAMAVIENLIPQPTQEEFSAQFKTMISELWQQGLVSVHDFDGITCWNLLKELHNEQQLGIRVRKNIPYDHFDTFAQSALRTNDGDDWLNVGNLKLFSDGSLGPQTAAMSDFYENSNQSGELLLTEDEIFEIGVKAAHHGIGLSVHAIGDLANHVTLNALQRLREYEIGHGFPHLPHRIEHVQTIRPDDLPRLAQLDIIASVQPVHAPSDMVMAEKHLGKRTAWTYSFKSLLESGAKVVFGSDAPVEPVDPFQGIHAAVTRRRIDGMPGDEGWHPEQRISLDQALFGFSAAPAMISQKGDRLGKLSEGFKADFLILDDDPFSLNEDNLYQVKPLATFIDGKCVYQKENLQFDLD
jgi:predicted amidohydrolase YtcJ